MKAWTHRGIPPRNVALRQTHRAYVATETAGDPIAARWLLLVLGVLLVVAWRI